MGLGQGYVVASNVVSKINLESCNMKPCSGHHLILSCIIAEVNVYMRTDDASANNCKVISSILYYSLIDTIIAAV